MSVEDRLVSRVCEIVAGIAGPERTPGDATPSTPLADGGFWLDSMELFEVLGACEDAFGPLAPPLAEASPDILGTIGDLAAAIAMRRRA